MLKTQTGYEYMAEKMQTICLGELTYFYNCLLYTSDAADE